MKTESIVPYVWMLCGCFVFSLMVALTHDLRHQFPWQIIALVRAAIPFMLVMAWARAAGVQLVLLRPPILWLRSIAGSISLICCFYCFTTLSPSLVLTITSVYPIWIALLTWPLEKEMPSLAVWLAVVVSIIGVAIIQRPGGELAGNHFAAILAVIASLSTAIAMMGLNRLQSLDTRAIVVHFSGVALVFAAAVNVLREGPIATSTPHWLSYCQLASIGLTATLGQICLTKAFAHGPATKVAVVGLTQIVFQLIWDVVWFRLPFDSWTLLGVGLVAAPTAWVVGHRRNLPEPPPTE